MKTKCTLCGNDHYYAFAFKGYHVCEDCLEYIKNSDSTSSETCSDD